MNVISFDHIAIVPKCSQNCLKFFIHFLGFKLLKTEILISRGLKITFLCKVRMHVEILEIFSKKNSIYSFLKKYKSGIHHIALMTNDIVNMWNKCQVSKVILASKFITKGFHGKNTFFFHPNSLGGILIEICQ